MILAKHGPHEEKKSDGESQSLWVQSMGDQVDAINQIMKETGERTESVVLRKLVDEALQARRKCSSASLTEESYNESGKRLEMLEVLLMRLVRQVDILYRILDVCLVLLQDVLAEAYATRRLTWESLVTPKLREKGIDANELERQFQLQTDQAKWDAYNVTVLAKKSQESPK